MSPLSTDVFFYGLFMDRAVLEKRGVSGSVGERGVLRDWALRIGERATLVPEPGSFVYGILMSLRLTDLELLYQEPSVQMYRPVAVLVDLEAAAVPALVYVLSEAPQPAERNPEYAAKLRTVAQRVGLPAEYVASIM